ncbi:M20/M25/M40 family metallo-hydrolase [archaeon]|jgi:acetylornithine deacetylase/succinyl-diaminopimelate desuccinylase-like protein|nr:M20/M25/M40 family metallo-hydrolase [archaeon]MBT6956367.1 M20/M25/M40 family metallo-hydrolase [archaeon]MBT7128656.1 M20/M25/M40 family metallo-hydrolase [archaeon]
MNQITILKDLIRIDSQCTKSNKEIVDYIEDKLARFETQRFRFRDIGDEFDLYNLVVRIPGEKFDSPLVLTGHTDSVPVSSGWTKNPFEPLEQDGKIYGLGSSDMKAGLACMISAALSLDEKPKQDVYLIFTADEEGSLKGGEQLIKDFDLKNARVVVAEPTNGKIIYAQKGCLDLETEFGGFAAHSSKADFDYNDKYNAIYKAAEFCRRVIEYGKEVESERDPLLGCSTMNIGMIRGGEGANVVADKCLIRTSQRLVPSQDIQDEYGMIKKMALDICADSKCNPIFWGDSFGTDRDGLFISQLKGIVPSVDMGVKYGWTEAALFSKWGEAVIFGPGQSDQCHTSDESVNKKDLEIFNDIYYKLMTS